MRLIETCFILHLPHSSTEDYRWRREDEDEDEDEEGGGEIRWPRKEAAERKWRREGRLIVLLAGVSLSAEIHNCLICVTLAMK